MKQFSLKLKFNFCEIVQMLFFYLKKSLTANLGTKNKKSKKRCCHFPTFGKMKYVKQQFLYIKKTVYLLIIHNQNTYPLTLLHMNTATTTIRLAIKKLIFGLTYRIQSRKKLEKHKEEKKTFKNSTTINLSNKQINVYLYNSEESEKEKERESESESESNRSGEKRKLILANQPLLLHSSGEVCIQVLVDSSTGKS